MNTHRTGALIGVMILLAWLWSAATPPAQAQSLGEVNAASEGMNNINGSSTGPSMGGGFNPVDRARGAAGVPIPGGPTAPGARGRGGAAPSSLPGATATVKKITVISGTRVFDAYPHNQGQLLDDAVKRKVPVTEKDKYYDNGTHGDLIADDQEYTKVDERRDVLGLANQRAKEQLIQALVVAEGYNPLEFYGYSLMSTDRAETAPRNRAWEIVPDPKGGPGFTLAERPIQKSLQVPKYRDKMKEKDARFKDENGNGWAYKFLEGYRKNSDSLTSDFYPLYIPLPPQVPSVAPPLGWQPFNDSGSLNKPGQMVGGRGGRGGGGGGRGGGMGGGGGGGGSRGSSGGSRSSGSRSSGGGGGGRR